MIDWNRTAADYSQHRAGFPPSIFPRLEKLGVGKLGHYIADLGTGTGTLGRGFRQQGATVFGLDIARALMEQAQILDAAVPVESVYLAARAEQLPFLTQSLQGVSAGQCWHWFAPERIYVEVLRVLKPGGYLAICNFDWLPHGDNLVAQTEQLILKFNPKWTMSGGTGLYPHYLPLLAQAGFFDLETFSYDINAPYSPEAWRGRIRASAGVSASLPPDEVQTFDTALAELLAERFPGEKLLIPHRVFAIVARAP
jgi:SAM-dependent methyltransferase